MMMMRNYEMIMLYILHDDIGENHLYDGESLGLLYLIFIWWIWCWSAMMTILTTETWWGWWWQWWWWKWWWRQWWWWWEQGTRDKSTLIAHSANTGKTGNYSPRLKLTTTPFDQNRICWWLEIEMSGPGPVIILTIALARISAWVQVLQFSNRQPKPYLILGLFSLVTFKLLQEHCDALRSAFILTGCIFPIYGGWHVWYWALIQRKAIIITTVHCTVYNVCST